MNENPTMRAAWVVAAALALAAAGCERPAGPETAALDALNQRIATLQETVPYRFGPASQTTAHITLFCDGPGAEDTCERSIAIRPVHQICKPGVAGCPTEMLWQVVGHGACWRPGDRIEIEQKSWQDGCFPQAMQTIDAPPYRATSGEAVEGCWPEEPDFSTWYYDVRLINEACEDPVVDSTDPVVIIEPY